VKRIGILETGHNSEALTPRFGRFADAFEAWLAQHRDTHPFELDVYRDWLAPAAAFVHECIGAGGRLLGVCFGHQLLAHALGGRVEKSHRGWGLGRHTYTVRERQPWMDPELAELSLLACHQDQVVTPPAGARVLASSEFCEYAMLAVGENVITVQAHPEFSAEYAGELYESRRERFGEEATERGLATLGEPTQADVFARWALRFLCA
jgi:GMP synthase-like glutamine amidotransferase